MNNKHSLLQMLPSYMTCSYRPQNATLDQGPPVVVIMAREAGTEPLAPPLHRTDLSMAKAAPPRKPRCLVPEDVECVKVFDMLWT